MVSKTFINLGSSLEEFYWHLKDYKFDDDEHVRPVFDTYFIRMAELASTRSNCMKRANGAIIVQDNRVVSTGYNGTPMGTKNCNSGGC